AGVGRLLVQPLVRVLHAAAHGEVAGDEPDEDHEDQDQDADRDSALPAPAPPGPPDDLALRLRTARPLSVAVGAPLERNLALRPAAAVDAIGLLSRSHSR